MSLMRVKPAASLKGALEIPGDKSISHRAIMLGGIAKGETVISGFLGSADCLATMDCFRKLGLKIHADKGRVIIQGKGLNGLTQTHETLYAGNSGTTVRLISGILSGQPFVSKINGDDSIQRRPMGRIAKPLRLMGASLEGRGENGEIFPPLKIIGGDLHGIDYELPVASAQVKSAVLLAGLFASGETAVIEKNISRDHTERMLAHFNAKIIVNGGTSRVKGGLEFSGAEVDVPGDISSAAFFLAAATIVPGSELVVKNVGVNPTRTGILDVLHRMGAKIEVMNEKLISGEPRADILVRSASLKGILIDGGIIPRIIDEIPIIAVLASQAEGFTEIRGARELRVKESDRIKTIGSELRKFGVTVEELEDGLRILGPAKLKGAKIISFGDHRIAMSMAVAGLIADGETVIENTDCIETSFPGFERSLKKVAA